MVTTSRVSRQAKIIELIETNVVSSQAELAELLKNCGISVSQGTLSRDLVDIGAVRVRDKQNNLVYASPDRPVGSTAGSFWDQLAKLCQEMVLTVDFSANLVVLKTPAGGAQYFASMIDRVSWTDVIGSLAGDDTVLLVTRDSTGGDKVAEVLTEMANTAQVPAWIDLELK